MIPCPSRIAPSIFFYDACGIITFISSDKVHTKTAHRKDTDGRHERRWQGWPFVRQLNDVSVMAIVYEPFVASYIPDIRFGNSWRDLRTLGGNVHWILRTSNLAKKAECSMRIFVFAFFKQWNPNFQIVRLERVKFFVFSFCFCFSKNCLWPFAFSDTSSGHQPDV